LFISFYPSEIEPIKNSIIKLLTILHKDKDDNIRNKSIYIYNKIKKQYDSSNSINQSKKKKYNLYFYDFGYDNWFNKKELYTNRNNNQNNANDKRLLSRNPTYTNLNLFNDQLQKKNFKN